VGLRMGLWEEAGMDSLTYHSSPTLPYLHRAGKAGGLWPSSTLLDTPRSTAMGLRVGWDEAGESGGVSVGRPGVGYGV
jgi:hypothetical protein